MSRFLTAEQYRKKHGVADKRGPTGRRVCVCGTEVPSGRIYWCSTKCVLIFKGENDWTYIRRQVEKRDHGICAICKVDTCMQSAKHSHLLRKDRAAAIKYSESLHVPNHRSWGDWWDADHIVPVVEGGKNSIDNLRTLCIACHLNETAKLRKRLAKPKRIFVSSPSGDLKILRRVIHPRI